LKKHVKLYLSFFGYDTSDFIPCEVCGKQAQDIHHIEARGMGGSKLADHVDNLQAVDRECHIKYGDKKQYIEFLKEIHSDFIKKNKK